MASTIGTIRKISRPSRSGSTMAYPARACERALRLQRRRRPGAEARSARAGRARKPGEAVSSEDRRATVRLQEGLDGLRGGAGRGPGVGARQLGGLDGVGDRLVDLRRVARLAAPLRRDLLRELL